MKTKHCNNSANRRLDTPKQSKNALKQDKDDQKVATFHKNVGKILRKRWQDTCEMLPPFGHPNLVSS